MSKRCSKCGKELPATVEFFYRDRYHTDGLKSECKTCCLGLQRRYKKSNAGRESSKKSSRKKNLKSKYGITLAQYDKMFEEQGGVCAVCGKPETTKNSYQGSVTKRLSVDHDHRTGKVRGLLCQKCNTLLGMADENVGLLINVMRYLHNAK